MPIDDFTYLMKRGYTYRQLEKMVNDGVNIKELRIKERDKESKENLSLLAGKTDSLSFLLEHGMTLEEIKRFQKDGISLDEAAASAKRMVDRGEALTDGGCDHHEQAEEKQARKKKPYLTEEILEDYLVKNDMSVRLNIITHDIEVEGIPDTYNPETRRQDLPVILYDDLKINYRCDRQSIVDLLSLIAGRNRYNPVLELIDSGEWDKHDYFGDLVEILGIHKEDNLSQTLLYKWLVQCYQMLKNDINHAYGADGMLVLQGPQGIGKTSFVRCIGIRPDFVKLGQYLDTKDKDTLRRCTSAWIVELGEIETTLKSDIERLKAFITAEKDEYRLPYHQYVYEQIFYRHRADLSSSESGSPVQG